MKVLICVFAILASSVADFEPADDDFEIDWAKVVPADLNIAPEDEASFNVSDWLINNNRIVGGQAVQPNSLPYQAALISKSIVLSYLCGGSLISKKYVLTAAHCLNKRIRVVQVILGAHKLKKKEPAQKRFKSKKFLYHSNYSSVMPRYDIGLVELPTPVELTENIKIIPLPSFSEASNDFAGKRALISGWGSIKNKGGKRSDVLRSVEAGVLKNLICKREFGLPISLFITDKIVCTSGKGSIGACTGDFGGPLVVNGKQIGITAFVHRDGCDKGLPTAFTRVTAFLDWIKENSDAEIGA